MGGHYFQRKGAGNDWECQGRVASGVLAFVGVAEDHEHFILKVWEHTKVICDLSSN